MLLLNVLTWLLLPVTLHVLVYWVVFGNRVRLVMRDPPTVRKGLSLDPGADPPPLVSIVIPVHNGQRVIDECARSLRKQDYAALQIIFVLDRCTDETHPILQRHADEDERVQLVTIDHCPEDWAGKCNAARIGAEHANGAYLLFADADTRFDPALVRASRALAQDRGLALLSLLSTLTCRETFERIAQPVATTELMRLYPISRVNHPTRPRPFANGQYMLFDRTWYDRIGGHTAVKDDLLEDLAFARRLHEQGGTGSIFLADGMLTCSMYESLGAFHRGWKRIFIEACRRKPRRLRRHAWSQLGIGIGAPLMQLSTLALVIFLITAGHLWPGCILIALIVLAWIAQFSTLIRIYRVSGAPAEAAMLYPLGTWLVARAMLEGAADLARRRPITWGGKDYILEPRR